MVVALEERVSLSRIHSSKWRTCSCGQNAATGKEINSSSPNFLPGGSRATKGIAAARYSRCCRSFPSGFSFSHHAVTCSPRVHFIRYFSAGTSDHFAARDYFFAGTNLRRHTERKRFSTGTRVSPPLSLCKAVIATGAPCWCCTRDRRQ